MFHDPSLERTTDGTGTIKTQPWNGVIEHVRTTKKPSQQLPTFHNVCELLMREENRHVKLNVSSDPFGDSTTRSLLTRSFIGLRASTTTDRHQARE